MHIIPVCIFMFLIIFVQAADLKPTIITQSSTNSSTTLHITLSNGDKIDITSCPKSKELPFYGFYTYSWGKKSKELECGDVQKYWSVYNMLYEEYKNQATTLKQPIHQLLPPRNNRACCSLQ